MLPLLFLLSAGDSEPASEDVFDILAEQEQVVNTGFIPLKANESAYGVWIIDRETILRTAATNLADLLRLVPGIVVREVSPGFIETYLRFTSVVPNNQSLVLLDGRSIQADIFNTADKTAIELKDIERIEVTMGPSSTLYGSNALTGVINIVSRKPEKGRTFQELELRSGAGLRIGQALPAGTFYGALNYGWDQGGVRVSAGGDYWPSFEAAPNRRISGALDIMHQVNGWELRARATGVTHGTTLPTFTNTPIGLQDYALSLTAKRNGLFKEGDTLTLSGFGRYYGLQYSLYAPPYGPASLDGGLGSGELRAQYLSPRFLFNNQLVAGAQVRVAHYEGQSIPVNARTTEFYSLYIEDNWRPIEQLLLTLGVRAETNENAALRRFQRLSFSPHAALVYLPSPAHSLRLEYGTSFRNPTLHESFLQAVSPEGAPLSTGDPNLPLERFSQFTFTYQGQINWFKPRVDFGLTQIDGVIFSSTFSAADAVDKSWPYGSSFLPALYKFQPVNLWLPFADFKLEADLTSSKIWLSYAVTPLAPMHLASAGLSTALWRLRFSTEVYFVSEYANAGSSKASGVGRLVWNAALRMALDSEGKWQAGVEGTNLLDTRFGLTRPTAELSASDFPGVERVGQRLLLSVRYGL